MVPAPVREWFWLLGAAVMLLYAAMVYAGAGALVRVGRVTQQERLRFAAGLGAATAGFCLAVQVVVWITGESRPECLAALPPSTPASLATTVLTLLGWGALLLWVWKGAGAETLARFAPAVIRSGSPGRSYAPAQARRFVTWLAVLATLGSIAVSALMPPPPDCAGRPDPVNRPMS